MRLGIVWGLLLCIWISAGGCVTDLPLPDVSAERKLVLLGELVAGDTLAIRLGQSVPVAKGNALQTPDGTGLVATVAKPLRLVATIYPVADDRTASLNTLLLAAPLQLFAGASYVLRVSGGGFPEVLAAVDMPRPFLTALIDTMSVRYAGSNALQIKLRIYDAPGTENAYSVEAVRQSFRLSGSFQYGGGTYDLLRDKVLYDSLKAAGQTPPRNLDTTYNPLLERLPLYTDDAETENLKLATAYTNTRRILLTDKSFEGTSHDLRLYVSKDRFRGTPPYDLGRIMISVKSTTIPYFNYLRAYETFTPTTSAGYLSQPVRIESNVVNGLGVVGGSFRVPFYFMFDPDPF